MMEGDFLSNAFNGNFENVLSLLAIKPELIKCRSKNNGYSVVHQAAWHGAESEIIGNLLWYNPDLNLCTTNKKQTPFDIVKEKHSNRDDLLYFLNPDPPTIAQVLRIIRSDLQDNFKPYDGNLEIINRLIPFFECTTCPKNTKTIYDKIRSAILSLIGVDIYGEDSNTEVSAGGYLLDVNLSFWRNNLLPKLHDLTSTKRFLLDNNISVISDLFDPPPEQWGLRGDYFLWLELHRALSNVSVPSKTAILDKMFRTTFLIHTGVELGSENQVFVKRLDQGGMSSGYVSSEFWESKFLPLIKNRLKWITKTWKKPEL